LLNRYPASLPAAPPASGLILPEERPADQVAFETAMVDFFVDAADLLGVSDDFVVFSDFSLQAVAQ
jgi:hypothetical protein